MDEVLRRAPVARSYFWRTTNGAEIDLVLEMPSGRRVGFEIKRTDAPRMTTSLKAAQEDPQLRLDEINVVYPGAKKYSLNERITAIPLSTLLEVPAVTDLH